MTDIVERLRDTNRPDAMLMSYQLRREAADEIERLRADRNDYQARVIPAETEVVRLEAQIMEAVRLARVSSMSADDIAAALQPSGQTLPKPGRNDGGEPCGECHLQPGETCDICGAAQPSGQTRADGWQTMESAPRDFVTDVDIWARGQRYTDCLWMRPTYGSKEYTWCHYAYDDCNGHVFEVVRDPEFWMPLPDAPSALAAQEKQL
jgi:hypothetical protein